MSGTRNPYINDSNRRSSAKKQKYQNQQKVYRPKTTTPTPKSPPKPSSTTLTHPPKSPAPSHPHPTPLPLVEQGLPEKSSLRDEIRMSTSTFSRMVPMVREEHFYAELYHKMINAHEDSPGYWENLSALSDAFNELATRTACTIICEDKLDKKKTIKPKNCGGKTGEKYLVHGILFKYVSNKFSTFPGWDVAYKVASHEFKGANFISSCGESGINISLISLINYRGFRIIAMAYLPLKKQKKEMTMTTLVYGGCNEGRTFPISKKVNQMFQTIAQKHNIQPYYPKVKHPEKQKDNDRIYTPADIEVHTLYFPKYDLSYYTLDTSRILPSDISEAHPKSHFYFYFRPEFLANTSHWEDFKLFPEIEKFMKDDNEKNVSRKNLKKAQLTLLQTIKNFANKLQGYPQLRFSSSRYQMINFLHSEGINLRYLGILLSVVLRYLKSGDTPMEPYKITNLKRASISISNEMIARVLKGFANDWMRIPLVQDGKYNPYEDTSNLKQIIVVILNHTNKKNFMTAPIEREPNEKPDIEEETLFKLVLNKYFSFRGVYAVRNMEMIKEYFEGFKMSSDVLNRLLEMTNWKVNSDVLKQHSKERDALRDPFDFNTTDIESYEPKTRMLGFMSFANAMAKYNEMKSKYTPARLRSIIESLKTAIASGYTPTSAYIQLLQMITHLLRFSWNVQLLEWDLGSIVSDLTQRDQGKDKPDFIFAQLLLQLNGYHQNATIVMNHAIFTTKWLIENFKKCLTDCNEESTKYFQKCLAKICADIPEKNFVIKFIQQCLIYNSMNDADPDYLKCFDEQKLPSLPSKGFLESLDNLECKETDLPKFLDQFISVVSPKPLQAKVRWMWQTHRQSENYWTHYPKITSRRIEQSNAIRERKTVIPPLGCTSFAPMGYEVLFSENRNEATQMEVMNSSDRSRKMKREEFLSRKRVLVARLLLISKELLNKFPPTECIELKKKIGDYLIRIFKKE
eukprot:TRINITY_DN24110_c0_g1_i1.p1 TRINITY_DN24110_c0_g1~~TRINITY_DN24110_c0_g1_i1.p1  ORF type:complete len:981 (-),score=188.24 TRINITY_DN24110_c0_g1_i1:14-2920(-)